MSSLFKILLDFKDEDQLNKFREFLDSGGVVCRWSDGSLTLSIVPIFPDSVAPASYKDLCKTIVIHWFKESGIRTNVSYLKDSIGQGPLWRIDEKCLQEITNKKEDRPSLEILLDGFDNKRIHPSVDFTDDVCLLGFYLPVNDKGREKTGLCLLSSERELFFADSNELSTRGYSLAYQPVEFTTRMSLPSIKEWVENKKSSSPLDIFNHLREFFKTHIDFSEPKAYSYFSLWTMGTYFHQLFNTYPYIYLGGWKASGKTKTLTVLHCLCFNSVFSGNLSSSAMFRLIQNARCTMLIDETESLSNPERAQDFRNILLNGYKTGVKVHRSERTRKDRFEVSEFECYSPKAIANIRGLEDVLESRCIPFTMIKTSKKDVGGTIVDHNDPRWQAMRDELYILLLDDWKSVKDSYDKTTNEAELESREWELWRPILSLARYVGGEVYREMLELAVQKSKEKHTQNVTESAECVLMESLLFIVDSSRYYSVKEIKNEMANRYEEEQKWLNSRWVGRALGRLNFNEKRRVGSGVEYMIDPDSIKDLAGRLGVTPSQTTQNPQTTLNKGVVSVESAVSVSAGEIEEEYPDGIPPHPNLIRAKAGD